MQKQTILVTGGLGYIGSHTVTRLIENGYDCIIVDNCSNSKENIIDVIETITTVRPMLYTIDIRDKEALSKVFQNHRIDAVIHFAGLKSVGESMQNPGLYNDNNIIGSHVLYETMLENGVTKVLFSSSASVYGSYNTPPIKETDKTGCDSPYGRSKLIIEHMLEGYYQANKISAIALRYFNPLGAHPSGLLGEIPNGIPSNLMPYIMMVLTGDLKELKIYGDDYDTADGTAIRDFIHIMDLAEGHIKALEYLLKQETNIYDVVNLGTGQGSSIKEMIGYTERVTNQKVAHSVAPRRPGDVIVSYCSNNKAQQLFGWSAEHTIEQAIADMRKFYSQGQFIR